MLPIPSSTYTPTPRPSTPTLEPTAALSEGDKKATLIAANEATKSVRLSLTPPSPLPPTATPRPSPTAGYETPGVPWVSPNGEWTAVTYHSWEQNRRYRFLVLEKNDGANNWTIEKALAPGGGTRTEFAFPYFWSADGRYLYYRRVPSQDGCGASRWATISVHRINLQFGTSEIILDTEARWLAVAPDESAMAYVGYGRTGLSLLDLHSKTETHFPSLFPDQNVWLTSFVWSADSQMMAFAALLNPCASDEGSVIVLVDFPTQVQTILAEFPGDPNEDRVVPRAWVDSQTLLVGRWANDRYHLDIHTGQLTPLDD